MEFLVWILLITRSVSSIAAVIDTKETRTQTINTAPITIHVPLPKSDGTGTHEQSAAPAAIAHEAPEGTYIIPFTEKNKESPPAINLVLNLRLVMDGEKKPEQSEAVTVLTDDHEHRSPSPAPVKANPGDFEAHEVKIVTPNANANLNPGPTQAPSSSFPGELAQDDSPALSSPQGNIRPYALRQPSRNFGVVPSFLLVPKRRVVHNVRSNMKATVPGSQLEKFRQQFLFEHNKKRLLHGVPPLTEDQSLDTEAQTFATELAKQKNTSHTVLRKRVGHGENIALRCSFKGSPLTGARATNLWYDESRKFNWKTRSLTPATERFTQLVWRNTTKVGFGRSQFVDNNGRTCFVVVARYNPAANAGEKIFDNVLEPIKAPQNNNGTRQLNNNNTNANH